MTSFTLHPQQAADCEVVGELPICTVLLNKQFSQFPWLILVPRRTGCRDLTDVGQLDFPMIMDEVAYVHDAIKTHHKPTKMNVGALGNMVPQLHIHVIARTEGDECWPKPVWGHATAKPYSAEALKTALATYRSLLADGFENAPLDKHILN